MNYNFAVLIGFFALVYFMMIRPQKKQQEVRKKMLDEISVGDEITTIGGIRGTITELNSDSVQLEIAPNVEIEILKNAIGQVIEEEDVEYDEKDVDSDENEANSDSSINLDK